MTALFVIVIASSQGSAGKVGGGYAHSVKRAFTPRGPVTAKQDLGTFPADISGAASINDHAGRVTVAPDYIEGGRHETFDRRTRLLAHHRAAGVHRRVAYEQWTASLTRWGCAARRGLGFYRTRYVEWTRKRDASSVPSRWAHPSSCPRFLAHLWQRKARAARLAFERWFEHTLEKWRCIHEHEGSWDDPNPPYWGGLQMTLWFQQRYGPEFYARWGTADRWPVWAQLIAAERAWRESGFRQWGTAWRCGLA